MKAVVFDLDGTLIDSYRDIAAALNDVLVSLDLPPHDPEQVKTMIGGGVATLLSRALGERVSELFEPARARFKDAYQARLTETTCCYDGVEEMLEGLGRAGIAIAVATNKPSSFTREIARALKLDRMGVSAYACADEVADKKPDPAVVTLALERAGAAECLAYSGDMPVDLETGQRAGLEFIGVAWGFDPAGLVASGCRWLVHQPKELMDLLFDWEKSKDKHQT